MSVKLSIQSNDSFASLPFFQKLGLTDPLALSHRVNRNALITLLNDVPDNTYTVFVSQAVIDTLRGAAPVMNNEEWINLKFIATVLENKTLINKADLNIQVKEYEVKSLNPFPSLPLPTKQWKLKFIPNANVKEPEVLDFIAKYKESITHIDLSNSYIYNISDILFSIIKHCKNIEILNFNGKYLEASSFRDLNSLTKLKYLTIGWSSVAPDFTGMSQLTHLNFSTTMEHEVRLDLTPLPNLESLGLQGDILTTITHLKNLKSLKIKCYGESCPADLTIFPDLTALDIVLGDSPFPRVNLLKLESLNLKEYKKADLNFLASYTNLKTLKIQYSHCLEDVSVLRNFTQLTSLTFAYCHDLDEIPDLSGHQYLTLLELKELPYLNKVPKVSGVTTVDTSKLKRPEPLSPREVFWDTSETQEHKIINDPNIQTVEITTLKPYKLIHLENLSQLTKWHCYFPINVKKVYVNNLSRCQSLDFSHLKKTTDLTITNSSGVKTIAFNAKDITRLCLSNLPKLEEMRIEEFSYLAVMQLPSFVERAGAEVLKFTNADQNIKNQFFAKLTEEILRYKTIKEIKDYKDWRLFNRVMQGSDYLEYIKIIYPCFVEFVNSISSRKIEPLPIHARLYFLHRLLPGRLKASVEAIDQATLDKLRGESMRYEGALIKQSDALASFKKTYLDTEKEIPPTTMESISKIPGRYFMAFYLNSPALILPFIPLMNEYQLAVTIPLLSLEQFRGLLEKQPPKYAKNGAADYLAHATDEQTALKK